MNRMLNKRIWIKGLTMQCPHGTPARDCPLNGLRSLPLMQANNVINEMSDHQVNSYLKSHRHCYNHRKNDWGDPVV